ncbi:MAG: hypothetical protein HZC02_05385 [Candidatus Levybacteria bacterium]|nr:hypothetical protein [Candidatus Levybacteria bacterium]
MADENLIKAVEQVFDATQQGVIRDACRKALTVRTDESMRAALITTRESAATWVAKGIANRALGFEQ